MKNKVVGMLMITAMSICLATGCGQSASKETQQETTAETVAQTETVTETETAVETETVETEAVTETEAETETETEDPNAEKVYDAEKTMYMIDDAYIRENPDAKSAAVTVGKRGSELKVSGEIDKWYHVTSGEKEGYVVKDYVTEDKAEAEAAEEAEAAAQAAAKAAEAQAAQSQSQSAPQGKYEVSRQKFDDCDGSGHGYYQIQYSDGSTATEEY